MNLARFPRIRLGHMPTPLERMEALSRHLGGPEIWIKRDDCTGLSTGGNKTRKLEYLMADALAQGKDFGLCLRAMAAAAEAGWKETENMVAKIGRASRLGERSRGVLDAGATSCCLLLESLAQSMEGLLTEA